MESLQEQLLRAVHLGRRRHLPITARQPRARRRRPTSSVGRRSGNGTSTSMLSSRPSARSSIGAASMPMPHSTPRSPRATSPAITSIHRCRARQSWRRSAGQPDTRGLPTPPPPPVNQPPVADFSVVGCVNLACSFTDGSTDDAGVVSRSWTFGDGASSTAQNPSHSYAVAGTYSVTLIVTDGGGLQDDATKPTTVTAAAPATMTVESLTGQASQQPGTRGPHGDRSWWPVRTVAGYRARRSTAHGRSEPPTRA